MEELKYIRFGEIPENGKSNIYVGERIVGNEIGLSVYHSCEINGEYMIVIPNHATKNTLNTIKAFYTQLSSDKYDKINVYLVSGTEVGTGIDNEPLIDNVEIIKEITDCFKLTKTDKLGKQKKTNALWKDSFDEYLKLAISARDRLLSDKDYKEVFSKYYPKHSFELSVNKSFDMFWGKEDGWNLCKRKRSSSCINLYSAMKKNIDKNLVYIYQNQEKKSYNKDKYVNDRIKYLDDQINKKDPFYQ